MSNVHIKGHQYQFYFDILLHLLGLIIEYFILFICGIKIDFSFWYPVCKSIIYNSTKRLGFYLENNYTYKFK